ncbi:MAG: sigma-70 family polymerase sigma factor, partial [Bacteroidetes bacterium]|nr:sigma-70 family polymerase sigma factor [Bacteroidota bacterium]
ALLALMCFHASRFDARRDQHGELVLYEDQDDRLWNTELIARGGYYMSRAARGDVLSRFHLEAAIAYWHTQKADTKEKWETILQLYNRLLQMHYSPIAALNRTYALSKANGKEEAIREAEKLDMKENHFYFTLLGELYGEIDKDRAGEHFQRALSLARTTTDKLAIQKKLDILRSV